MLADLRAGDFIYEQPAKTGVEYVFKHALTQEVAYNSMLIERRKQIHERTARALESIFAGQLDDHLTQLAHHYSHSDNVGQGSRIPGTRGPASDAALRACRCGQWSHCGNRSPAEATGRP